MCEQYVFFSTAKKTAGMKEMPAGIEKDAGISVGVFI